MARGKRREAAVPRGAPEAPPVQPAEGRRRVLPWALSAGLVALVFAAFSALSRCGFVDFDDIFYVSENSHVLHGLSWDNVAWALGTTYFSNWHPLTWLSHMLDVQLFGLDAGAHHMTSVVLHAANSALLLLVLARMTGALWRSALVAALFAIHPLHVESVAWVAERKDVLSTLFWLLTLAAWLGYVRSRKRGWYLWAIASYALGLMAKPMLVTLPFTLLLLDYWPLGRLTLPLKGQAGVLRGLLLEKLPLFVLSVGASAVTYVAQKSSGAVQTMETIPLLARVANAFWSYAAYLGKTFWPTSLSVFYPYRLGEQPPWAVYAVALTVVAATLLVIALRTRIPFLAVGWFWYLGTLVPVIGLVQVGGQAMADRYTYVPLVGIFVALVWGASELVKGSPAARAALAVAALLGLVPLFVLTRVQVGYWKDSFSLFEHALAVTTNNAVAHNSLGVAFADKGMYREAAAHYDAALEIDPKYGDCHNNLGVALVKLGRLDEAGEHYRLALQLLPDDSHDSRLELWIKLGSLRMKQKRYADAVDFLERVLEDDPASYEAHLNLGVALGETGRPAEAVDHLREALQTHPDSVQALTCLGQNLSRLDRVPEGVESLRRALEIDPKSVEALVNLGVALDRQGRTQEALEQFETAVRTDPSSAPAAKNLGLALARMNRLPGAIESLGRAVGRDPDDAESQYALGLALARASRFAEARTHFQEAVRLRPEDPAAREGLARVEAILNRGSGGAPAAGRAVP